MVMDATGADSARCSAIDSVVVVAATSNDATPPSPATSPGAGSRVKLLVSYGGRIQPRPHDNTRLAYVSGETKILALDRSVRPPKTQPSPSTDFLFGFDEGFVPPPVVKVAVNPQPLRIVFQNHPTEAPAMLDLIKDEPSLQIKASAELVATAADIERLVYPNNLPPLIPLNKNQDTVPLVHPSDFQLPLPPQWPETPGRFPSLSPGMDPTRYLLQCTPGMYPGFYPAPLRMTVNGVGGGAATGVEAYAAAGNLAYDSAGWLVYCTPGLPPYQAVTGAALKQAESTVTASRPPQTA